MKEDMEHTKNEDVFSSDEDSSDHSMCDEEESSSEMEWDADFDINDFRQEIRENSNLPLLQTKSNDAVVTKAKHILHYLLLFLLLFKAYHHISNTGFEDLLQYFKEFLQHTEPSNEVLLTVCLGFPSTLYAAKTLID